MTNKDSVYSPLEVENKWYKYWMDNKLFAAHPDSTRPPYTIVIPPPNVTGVLHMGHMLNNTIQDILIRWARLRGYNTCWVPGTDHASIATEAKVVARLAEQGIEKNDLSCEEFLKHAWEWTHEHGGIILEQLKRLGASCDWDRTAFTLDEVRSESVKKVFCDLYRDGLIYRGVRIVNWDPKAKTALSDEEVIYKDEQSHLYYLIYKAEDGNGSLIVATTRPETVMGDTAVCVHPDDERYKSFIGRKVIVPGVGRAVKVIADSYIEMEFGTGCLKVTPAHDVNDYNLGLKHNLESIDIFHDDGTLNEHGGKYEGLDRFEVRKLIIEDLQAEGLVEKVENYTNRVGCSERTNVPIEPKLSMQWFLKMEKLSKPALEAVEKGEVRLIPSKFINTYRHWMENVKDWCISRQLRWGHRIPAYYLPDGRFVVAENQEDALIQARELSGNPSLSIDDLTEDNDCLDTWFSSWLWPMSVFGDFFQKDQNEDLRYFYPTSVLVTGPDILFFWVARMIIAGYRYMGKAPFKDVYLTGIVRDAQGRKMSKSLGNSPDPLALIDQYGADGMRVGLMMGTVAGNDLLYEEVLLEQGRNFCNKIWNAFRLLDTFKVDEQVPQSEVCSSATRWFEARMNEALIECEDLLAKYRISEALTVAYKLFRDDFSSFYLEAVKPIYGTPIDKTTYTQTLSFFTTLLKLLHPYMPFITEDLWHRDIFAQNGSIMQSTFDDFNSLNVDQYALSIGSLAKDIVSEVRNIRQKNNMSPKERISLYVDKEHLHDSDAMIDKLANVAIINAIDSDHNHQGIKVSFIVGTRNYFVVLNKAVDKEEVIKKLQADLLHQKKFLEGVRKKLANDRFVTSAPKAVVEMEYKKEADALSRIETLEKQMAQLGE